MTLPTRVRIISGIEIEIAPGVFGADPAAAAPRVGELGWMTREYSVDLGAVNPRIVLDSGAVLWGYECWWEPLDSTVAS